jgi:hypothetical protein
MRISRARFILAINKHAEEYYFSMAENTKECEQRLSSANLSFYEILVLTFACKSSGKPVVIEESLDTAMGSSEIIVSIAAKSIQAMIRFFSSNGFSASYIGSQIAQYISEFNMGSVNVGPWFKFWIAFCSDSFKSLLAKIFEAFQKFMDTVGSVTQIPEMGTLIGAAIYGIFSAAGAVPPSLTLEKFQRFFIQELQAWDQMQSLENAPLTPFGQMCKTLTQIADWRYNTWSDNPGPVAEELMDDLWTKILEGMSGLGNVSIQILTSVSSILQGISNWAYNNPGQAVTLGVIIAIGAAIIAASLGTATPEVAAAIILIAGALGISLEGMTQQDIEQVLMEGTQGA